jgi:EAL domain-containing protein (putative c-di-GMP-specific phosphodiesterase class I)
LPIDVVKVDHSFISEIQSNSAKANTNAINAITDENALNWFQHCGLYFEPFR